MSLRTIKRRRIEKRTDYRARMAMLKSVFPRIVIRRTNKYFGLQIVESKEAQDKIIFGITSKDLMEYGWSEKNAGSLKSIPAAYLTGYLLAKKVVKGEYIIDLGISTQQRNGRAYAVAAGMIDGGLKVRANPEVFPPKERLMGEHLKPEVKKMIAEVKAKLASVSIASQTTKKESKVKTSSEGKK